MSFDLIVYGQSESLDTQSVANVLKKNGGVVESTQRIAFYGESTDGYSDGGFTLDRASENEIEQIRQDYPSETLADGTTLHYMFMMLDISYNSVVTASRTIFNAVEELQNVCEFWVVDPQVGASGEPEKVSAVELENRYQSIRQRLSNHLPKS